MSETLPPISGTSAQVDFTNQQTFNIDIGKFYDDIITSIDKIRSHVSISQNPQVIADLIKFLSNPKVVTDPNNPQESRCSAFYRLLGLPVIEPGNGNLYSPGYDINDETLKDSDSLKQHFDIISAIPKELFDLMNARETTVNSFLSIFALSNQNSGLPNINASTLALSLVAGGSVRKFTSSFTQGISQNTGPFDPSISNQSYTITGVLGQVPNSASVALLNEYLGPDGLPPITALNPILPLQQSPLLRRAHLLKPFMTDPRVDFTINPPNGMVCAPFAQNKSKTKYTQDIYLARPYIETICRFRCNKRLNQTNQAPGQGTQSQRYQDLQAYIKNTSDVRNKDLLAQISQDPETTVQDQILLKFVNIMNSMVNTLHNSITIIQQAEADHQWIPIVNIKGPEFGMTTSDIFLISTADGAGLDPILDNYPQDKNIIQLIAQIQLQNVNAEVQQPDLGNFAFSGIQSMPDNKATEAFGNLLQETLDAATSTRTDVCSRAAEALKNVEIIMGEFSGLGLCDILAIFTALWTVDEKVLISLLDKKAFDRLYTDPNLRDEVVSNRAAAGTAPLDGIEALKAFEAQVYNMLVLQDKLYEDVSQNNTSGT